MLDCWMLNGTLLCVVPGGLDGAIQPMWRFQDAIEDAIENSGADVNSVDAKGHTPLTRAVAGEKGTGSMRH